MNALLQNKLKKMSWEDLRTLGMQMDCPPLYMSNPLFKDRLRKVIQVLGGKDKSIRWSQVWNKTENRGSYGVNEVSSTIINITKDEYSTSLDESFGSTISLNNPKNIRTQYIAMPKESSKQQGAKTQIRGSPSIKGLEKSHASDICYLADIALRLSEGSGEEKIHLDEADKFFEDEMSAHHDGSKNRRPRVISRYLPQPKEPTVKAKNWKIELSDFDILKEIGRGSFGKVFQVMHIDSRKIYALKVLRKKKLEERNQVEHTKTERKILRLSTHPYCVTLRYAFQTRRKLFFVMDFYRGGELFFHLQKNRRFSMKTVKLWVAQITLALGHLHKHSFIYRDLKPENVLVDGEGHIALTDFGMAKGLKKGETTNTFCGTPEYLAPEVILRKPHDKEVDWWSLGILCYELVIGVSPFSSTKNVHAMYKEILRGRISWRRREHYLTMEIKSFIIELLERNPKYRLGHGEDDMHDVGNHDFLSDLDFDAILARKVPSWYKPRFKGGINNKKDTSNFALPSGGPDDRQSSSNSSRARQYSDFTYQPEPILGSEEKFEFDGAR